MAVILKKGSGTACSVVETVRYSTYGVPFGITPGDIEGDGDVDGDDNTNWPGSYQVRCDYDLDGDMDITDQNLTITNTGRTLGRGVLSHSSVASRKGYAGYEHDGVIDELCHVRFRALHTDLGRFLQRDPSGYVDGMSLYEYVASQPVAFDDPMGLQKVIRCAVAEGGACATSNDTNQGVEGIDGGGGGGGRVGGLDPIADDPTLPNRSRLNRCLARARRDYDRAIEDLEKDFDDKAGQILEEAERQYKAVKKWLEKREAECTQECDKQFSSRLKRGICHAICISSTKTVNGTSFAAYKAGAAALIAELAFLYQGMKTGLAVMLAAEEQKCRDRFGP